MNAKLELEILNASTSGQSRFNIGLDREQVMRKWDSWREYIASGGTDSWPRDDFECLLDAYEEAITVLRSNVKVFNQGDL